MTGAREAILARVRAATAGAVPVEVERTYRRVGTLDREGRVALACERIGDYRAEVRRVPREGLGAAIGEALAVRDARRVCIPPGLPEAWRPPGVELVEDGGLTPEELDGLDGVVTGSTVTIAETGTIVLTSAPSEGRRALTLVPDLHVCVVEEASVVETVPEALDALAPLFRDERRPVTFVSGPSATSDIELARVEGVHGPRTLVVLVVA